jgi:hypothetical protein
MYTTPRTNTTRHDKGYNQRYRYTTQTHDTAHQASKEQTHTAQAKETGEKKIGGKLNVFS